MHLKKLNEDFQIYLEDELNLMLNLGIDNIEHFRKIRITNLDIIRYIDRVKDIENIFPAFTLEFRLEGESSSSSLCTLDKDIFEETDDITHFWGSSIDTISCDDPAVSGQYYFSLLHKEPLMTTLKINEHEFKLLLELLNDFKLHERLKTIFELTQSDIVNKRVDFLENIIDKSKGIIVKGGTPLYSTPSIRFYNSEGVIVENLYFPDSFYSYSEKI